jgi:hypothetical protein
MPQRIPSLYVAPSKLGGRGVFTEDPLEAGDLIEICPVIVLPPTELPVIHGTRLHDYYFLWGDAQDACAIALGYGSLYNHAYEPNARYLIDYEHETIDFYCIRPIEGGEEITVNYNGEPDDGQPVWFDKKND